MKKIVLYIACLMTVTMSSYAQESTTQTIKADTDATLSFDDFKSFSSEQLMDYISTPENKARFIDVLNAKIVKSKEHQRWDARITDVSIHADSVKNSDVAKAKNNSSHKAAIFNYPASYKMEYNTINGKGDTIKASAMIYYYDKRWYTSGVQKWGVLSCHPTVTDNAGAPTGSDPLDYDVCRLYDESCFIVCPDYCGYGTSSSEQHPYLIQDITAHNCIDSYLAALDVVSSLGITLASDYYTYILGYSQGGSVALACQKLYESDIYSAEDKAKINVTQTYCGDGPYSPTATINQYVEWANSTDSTYCKLSYPCVLPLILMAAKDAYDNDCMHTVEIEDFFKPEFLEKTGCVDAIKGKVLSTDAINEKIWAQGFYTIDQMLSDSILNVTYDSDNKKTVSLNTETNACKCLMRALEKNNLTTDWTPTIPITFFHYTGDLVVPYANLEAVKAKVDSGEWTNVKLLDAKEAYDAGSGIWYSLASYLEVPSYDTWDHVSVGTVFYVWLLFSDARPNNQ